MAVWNPIGEGIQPSNGGDGRHGGVFLQSIHVADRAAQPVAGQREITRGVLTGEGRGLDCWAMSLPTRRFRNKPTAFWCIGSGSIEVAVIGNAIGEPILLDCAGLESRSIARSTGYGAGLSELVSVLQVYPLRHVAALAEPLCRASAADPGAEAPPGRIIVASRGGSRLICDADAQVARSVALNFRRLGLRLCALDCEVCARASLAAFLGETARGDEGCRDLDPLAAVSVAPEIEADALRMGARLAVPVGLALGYLGWLVDA